MEPEDFTVSSDDVINSYRQQLSDAMHRIAVLEAQIAKMRRTPQSGQAALQTGR